MATLPERTQQILRSVGWNEHYVCSMLEEYQQALISEGYEIHPKVLDFLHKFGGLHVTFPHHSDPHIEDSFHTDPKLATDEEYIESVLDWSAKVGAPLCPIGQVYRRNMTLVMDPDERVFAGTGDLLLYIAHSGEQIFENLYTGKETPQIERPSDVPQPG